MLWADTTAGIMKMRNGANSAWISLWELDGTFIASDISLSAGTAGAPSLYFTGDTNTGIYSPGADQVAISTNGTGRLFVDASGNVGVGVSPTNASGYSTLDINNATNGGRLRFLVNGTAYGLIYNNAATDFRCGTGANVPFHLISNASIALTVDTSQRVGIGTTSPSYALHVAGTVNSSDANLGLRTALTNGLFQAREFGGSSANNTLEFNIRPDSGKSGYLTFTESSVADRWSIGIQNGSDGLRFISGTPTSGTERCRIDGSGRLLVGTSTAPTGAESQYSKLRVTGNTVSAGTCYASFGTGGLATSLASGNVISRMMFGSSDGEFAWIDCAADATPGTNDYPGRLVFSTTADGSASPSERFRIGSAGQLGIGGATYGTSGQVLTSGGASAAPSWTTVGNGAGTLKAWVNFNGTGTVAIRASGNVSSITDNGTGDYTVNFTTALADANYCITGTMGDYIPTNTARSVSVSTATAPSTSAVRIVNIGTGGAEDQARVSVAIFR
jgi:hypothetical protein